jgi:transformation/transcription domain-associated protein
VYNNVNDFVRRTKTMGYMNENTNRNVSDRYRLMCNAWVLTDQSSEAPPTVHAIVPLISEATSPIRLAQMAEPFVAWF